MKNIKNYTKGLLSFALLFFISNTTMAASTQTEGAVSNTTMFYVFLVLALVMLLAIYFLSGAIKNLLASDYYKEKIYEKEKKRRENNITPLVLLFVVATPFASFSQTTGISAVDTDMPIEWVWAMIVANAILVGVVLYLRSLFLDLLYVVRPKKVKVKVAKKVNEPSKLTQLLTDVVPLEREHEILTDHEYDGIRELDNNLPPWWLYSFYASIVFAFIYLLNYHVFETADLQIAEYNKEVKIQDAEVAEYLKSMKLNVDETSVSLLTDAADIKKGKALFNQKCVACHGKSGEGIIGPNLTDDYWIHGGDVKSVFKLIKYGFPAKGMQSWKDELNPVQIQQVASYIKSIEGTVEGGKEAEGDLYVGEGTEIENVAVSDSVVAVVDSLK